MNVREFFFYARRMVGVTVVGVGGAYAWRYLRGRQKRRLDQLRYERETKRLPTLEEWDAMNLGRGEFSLRVSREKDADLMKLERG
jgi:hypothetical protein